MRFLARMSRFAEKLIFFTVLTEEISRRTVEDPRRYAAEMYRSSRMSPREITAFSSMLFRKERCFVKTRRSSLCGL